MIRVLSALVLGVCLAAPVAAQQPALPADLKLSLLVKVLSFDRGLGPVADEIVVAVVYQSEVPASVRERDQWLDAAAAPLQLNGAQVRVKAVEYRGGTELLDELRRLRATIVFVTGLRGVDTAALAERVRTAGFRTATDTPALVSRSMAVGLLLRSGRPHIVINMPLAIREGSDFSSQLLRVAEVLR